jgi:hypothetical protein
MSKNLKKVAENKNIMLPDSNPTSLVGLTLFALQVASPGPFKN